MPRKKDAPNNDVLGHRRVIVRGANRQPTEAELQAQRAFERLLVETEEYLDFVKKSAKSLNAVEGNILWAGSTRFNRQHSLNNFLADLDDIQMNLQGIRANKNYLQVDRMEELRDQIGGISRIAKGIAHAYEDPTQKRKYVEQNNSMLRNLITHFISFVHKVGSLIGFTTGYKRDVVGKLETKVGTMEPKGTNRDSSYRRML